jgi:t-SNARE complex subunit (syntaxin)
LFRNDTFDRIQKDLDLEGVTDPRRQYECFGIVVVVVIVVIVVTVAGS